MLHWLIVVLVPLLLWAGLSCYLWLVRRRVDETAAGLDLLVAMHWREFAALVARALQTSRGLVRDDLAEGAPPSEFTVHDSSGQRRMVLCKHGRAYRIGAVAVDELASAVRLAGVQGGILATEGRVEREGSESALRQGIEILDGPRLWPMVRPLLRNQSGAAVIARARLRAVRQIGMAALGAVALGVLLAQLTPFATGPAAAVQIASQPPAATHPAPTATPAQAGAEAEAGDSDAEPDAATLLAQQHAVSKALLGAPGIVRGVWTTRSTLAVDRDEADDESAWKTVCARLEHYPALRTSRVQLNPRPGHDEPVRWRQCRTF